ncbi:hypothetical protein I4U23_022025 [Adineta vaga]|nr:hypothetical protein I4U23_022025 [Adineta vaga]
MASTDSALGDVLKPIGFMLSNIFTIAGTIRKTVERMDANETECRELSGRVDMIVEFLRMPLPEVILSEHMERTLRSFAEFLRECEALIEKFANTSGLKRIWNNEKYCRQFSRMNEKLSRFTSDLKLGMEFARLSVIESSRDSIEQNTQQQSESNDFNSGIWTYNRCINKIRQGTFNCELIVQADTKKIKGSGKDNFGHYSIDGLFHQTPLLIEMDWSYKDHLQIIQLQWDVDQHILCGMVWRKSKVPDNVCQLMGQFEMNLIAALSSPE